ncbi:MAG: DUF1460 domain-containing protein [Pseudomonadota bacterium]|nr:DUF1460 domain-containing protein [Pseudomonadota bacterium]
MWKLFVVLFLVGCGMVPRLPGHDFLGARYINSPLGEGCAPDSDPLIRFDAFDCTTFVETVMANGDIETLNQIRYKDGKIGFLNRNHFIESDWLVNNSDRVQNVSADYAQTKIRSVIIDKRSWFKKVHNIDTDFKSVAVELEYIPYEFAKDLIIEKTMIVLFITDNADFRDKIGTDLAVVHMGLIMPNGVLRHASSERGAVVDVPFEEYVNARKKNKNNLGITLVEIK